jgi:hypothetical protein
MKRFLLALVFLAACDKAHHQGFGRDLARQWGKTMGAGEDAPVYCVEYQRLVGVSDDAYCTVRIDNRVYAISCWEDTGICIMTGNNP